MDLLRQEYTQSETIRKEKRRHEKETREYDIFKEMPYKFQGKKYTQNEKHPLSKKRFEVSCELIDNFRAESLTDSAEINNNLDAL